MSKNFRERNGEKKNTSKNFQDWNKGKENTSKNFRDWNEEKKNTNKKERISLVGKSVLSNPSVVPAAVAQKQSPAREERRDDQPECRRRNDRIDDNRTDAAGAREDRGNEVEIEYAEQPPIYRAE